MLADLDQWGCLSIGTIWPNFKKVQQFLGQNPNGKGVRFMKKLQGQYLGPHNLGRFEQMGQSA